MPSNLVRVTIDKKSVSFTVEYGDKRQPGLTELEEKEFKQLNEDLIEYSDFTSAEDLEDEERQQLMSKKKRLEELTEKRTQEHVDWGTVDASLIETLLIVCNPDVRHTYVENLPAELIRKLFEPQMTFNFGTPGHTVAIPQPIPPEKETPADAVGALEGVTPNELKVIQVLVTANANWSEYVSVKEKDGIVYVRPHKFLAETWGPINAALKTAYLDPWKSEGKGDKNAHWAVEVSKIR